MQRLFRTIERLFETGLEARLRRWLRGTLQPVEIAKAAARAMEASQVLGPDGPRVANRYRLGLHPADFERFASYRQTLARDVSLFLDREARRLGLRPLDRWTVALEADAEVEPGRVRVVAELAEVAASGDSGPAEAEATQRLTLPAPASGLGTRLRVGTRSYPLSRPVTTIGRALDNDVVLTDSRVSRYHAQIEVVNGEYRVRDLASTNGTFVRGRRVTEAILVPGDELSLGGLAARLEADD